MLILLVFSLLMAADVYFPSGLLQNFEIEESQKARRFDEKTAVKDFYSKYFKPYNLEIREEKRFSDKTHRHINFDYTYQYRKVVGYGLKIHYNQQGYIEYADSTLEYKIEKIQNEENPHFVENFKKKYPGYIIQEKIPVLWISEKGEQVFYAYEIHCHTKKLPRKIKHWVLKENDLQILEDYKVFRFAARDIYLASPLGTHPPLAQQVLNNLLSANQLQSSQFNVQREETTATLVDVDFTTNFSGAGGWDTDPANYTHTCAGTSAQCPNQGFDAVNVYYHLDTYRAQLNTYLTTLGATVSFSNDPLHVIVNSMSVDFDGNGTGTNDTNNAAFVSTGCRPGFFNQCLVFLRPAQLSGAAIASYCGASPADFYHLAREAIVIVHEYQHYVTHTITGLIGGGSTANVGDALHEGYSDYFGASQTSAVAGQTITKVGEYSFQECTPLMRELSTLRVYQNGSAETDSHISGLSWASGLWNLRTLYGQAVVDLIALKSLFFLSTRPGFVEAVEALVKADKALYGGSHVAKIRTLFYEDIKFIGGKTGVFKDTQNKIVEMGLRSCLGVPSSRNSSSLISLFSFILFLILSSKCIKKI